jgi:hypothetical protein
MKHNVSVPVLFFFITIMGAACISRGDWDGFKNIYSAGQWTAGISAKFFFNIIT